MNQKAAAGGGGGGAAPPPLPRFTAYLFTVQAAIVAESATFPLDITKTRLQLNNNVLHLQQQQLHPQQQAKRPGMLSTAREIIKDGGVGGLYQGIAPALLRHVIYTGIRINLYENIRKYLTEINTNTSNNTSSIPLWQKALSGATSGVIAQAVASPTDLVKVRLQAQRRPDIKTNFHYRGMTDAFYQIAKQDGLRGLWKGAIPNMQRAALVNLGELATYDQSKEFILKMKILNDGIITHTIAAMMSGFVASVLSCPADVVKTRMMNQPSKGFYTSSIHCLTTTVRQEGIMALYKGFFPTWARLGPWQLTFWVVYEQLRVLTGYSTF